MGKENQGACILVLGIVLIVFGFLFWWPLIFGGVFFFCIGICSISQAKKQKVTTPQSTQPQPVHQQYTPPVVTQPVQEKPPEIHRFCPHCGARSTSNFCSECGSQID